MTDFQTKLVYFDAPYGIPIVERIFNYDDPKMGIYRFPQIESALRDSRNNSIILFRKKCLINIPNEFLQIKPIYLKLDKHEQACMWASFVMTFCVRTNFANEFPQTFLLFLFLFFSLKEIECIMITELIDKCSLGCSHKNGSELLFGTFQVEFYKDLKNFVSIFFPSPLFIKCGEIYFSIKSNIDQKKLTLTLSKIEPPTFKFAFAKSPWARLLQKIFDGV